MGASLRPGTAIRILLAEVESVGPGDVVAFVSGRRIVVHRIVAPGRRGAARDYWIARGDAETLPDPPVPRDAVLGPVRIVAADGRLAPVPAGRPPGRRARVAVVLARRLADVSVGWTRRLIVLGARLRVALNAGPSRTEADVGIDGS